MRKYTLVPLRHDNNNAGALQVAMADPMNILAMDDINIITGMQVVPILANAQDINAFLDKAFGQQQAHIRESKGIIIKRLKRKIMPEEKKLRMRL